MYAPPRARVSAFINSRVQLQRRAKGDWEVRTERTEVGKKIRNMPVDAVDLVSILRSENRG